MFRKKGPGSLVDGAGLPRTGRPCAPGPGERTWQSACPVDSGKKCLQVKLGRAARGQMLTALSTCLTVGKGGGLWAGCWQEGSVTQMTMSGGSCFVMKSTVLMSEV